MLYDDIREKIVWLELVPGSSLNLVELAESFGVSRNPVTIALNRLEAEGWLIRNGSHFVVPPLTMDGMRDLTEIRVILETQANVWAMNRMSPDGLKGLDTLQKKIENLPADADKREIFRLDIDFHRTIFRETKNRQLAQYLEWLLYQYIRFWLSGDRVLDPRALNVDTLRIIKAIKDRDEVALRAASYSHIVFSLDNILSWQDQYKRFS